MSSKDESGQLNVLYWGILIISTVILVCVPILNATIKAFDPTFSMVFLVIFGVIDFLVVLAIAGRSYINSDLACKEEALGLPSGSIRALIALSLIIIFAIMAIFMYNQLTPNQLLLSIPANQTLILPNGTALENPNGIAYMAEATQAQRDFSTQTLTTVSTLVVALAGFYFGTKAATTGKKKKEKEIEYDLGLTSKGEVEPNKPITIKVVTKPKDADIKILSVYGDNKDSVKLDKLSKEIIYKPSQDHKNVVMLTVALIEGDKIMATRDIELTLESVVIKPKQVGKAKLKAPYSFEIKTISAEGRKPEITIFGDDDTTIDKANISKGEFTYTPSQKGVDKKEVIIQVKLEGQPEILKPTVEVEK